LLSIEVWRLPPCAREAERDARRHADRERIEQVARALLTTDGWQRWMRRSIEGRIARMLALRLVFTAAVTAGCVWLLSTGKPLGGLVILPALAVWVRHAAESRRLTRFARRFANRS
jgi:Flp pilus assembly protein TadB